MEHNPLISKDNGLEITYSDLKKKKNGEEYITMYFEQPTADGHGFDSAECDYPYSDFRNIIGFTQTEIKSLWEYVAKLRQTAFDFSKEDALAKIC